MEDIDAIKKLKEGDLSGLMHIVERYQVQAVQAAQLILRDRDLAEEVSQSTFLTVAEKIHQFDEQRHFSPWFFRILVNNALKTARKVNRIATFSSKDDQNDGGLSEWLIDPQPLPEQTLEMKETVESIRAALARLSPSERAVVVMRYYLGMSEEEMSLEVDRPVSTIEWWLRSARRRLRELLRFSLVP
jgi:RNA polymerase sigma-70 factor (ECF subfamily)